MTADTLTVGQAIRRARELAGITQGELAQQLQMDRGLLSRREGDRAPTPMRIVQEVAGATKQTIAATPDGWAVFGPSGLGSRADPDRDLPTNPDRDQPLDRGRDKPFRIPLLGCASAGPGSWNEDRPTETVSLARRWLTRLDGAILVRGDSMEPLLRDGDLVGVRLGEDYEVGDLVIAVANYGECIIKVYAGELEEEQLLMLTSVNQSYPPVVGRIDEIDIQGVAYGLLRAERLRVGR